MYVCMYICNLALWLLSTKYILLLLCPTYVYTYICTYLFLQASQFRRDVEALGKKKKITIRPSFVNTCGNEFLGTGAVASGGGDASIASTSADTSFMLSSCEFSALSGSGPFSGGFNNQSGSGGSSALRAFSYGDLKAATGNFRQSNMLGEGGFGCVFKGHIDATTFMPTRANQGIVIAVKKLNVESLQGHKEWLVRIVLSSFSLC